VLIRLLAAAALALGLAGCSFGSGADSTTQAVFHATKPPTPRGPALDPTDVAVISPRVAFLTSGGRQGEGAGRIQRTVDGGRTWTTVWSGAHTSVGAVAFAGKKQGMALGIRGERKTVLQTTDGGSTWSAFRPKLPRTSGELIDDELHLVDAKTAYTTADPAYFTASSSIRTTDGGRSWRRAGFRHALAFFDRMTGYAIGYREDRECSTVRKTVDGGRTWREQLCSHVPLYAVEFLDRKRGFVAGGWPLEAERGPGRILLRTNDGGRSWTRMYLDRRGGYRTGIDPFVTLHFFDGTHGWARTGACKCCPSSLCAGKVMTTSDAGRTWRGNGVGVQLGTATRSDALLIPACGADGPCEALWRTRDRGRSWHPVGGLPARSIGRIYADGRHVFLETADTAVYASNDRGRTWRLVPALSRPGALWADRALTLRPGLVALASYYGDVSVSTNGGRGFRTVPVRRNAEIFTFAFSDAKRGLAVTGTVEHFCAGLYGGRTLYATQDGGRSWRKLPLAPFSIGSVGYTSGLVAAVGDLPGCRPALGISRDGAKTWQTEPLGGRRSCSVSVAPPRAVWLGCAGVLRVSSDGGKTWRDIVGSADWLSVAAASDKEAWAKFDRGGSVLWHTVDGGRNWTQVWPRLAGG
jgi:photosystem II stability/assembly factor-like uncharacterized protein